MPVEGPAAYVRLIDAAVGDLERIAAKDPNVLRAVLKKMLLLESDPNAGNPLLGELVGFRKLTVGDRQWRIIWRTANDADGNIEITIAEVWAVGARADDEVYDEMRERVKAVPDREAAKPLQAVVEMLGRHAARPELAPATEPERDVVPPWLRERLFHTMRLPDSEIAQMSGAEAMTRWERFMTGQG